MEVDTRDPFYIGLGRFMAKARAERGFTQVRVAGVLGVHYTTLTHYESGTHRISMAMFVRWCEVLGLQPGLYLDRILGLVPDPADSEKETQR